MKGGSVKSDTWTVLFAIEHERQRQNEKWGEQNHEDSANVPAVRGQAPIWRYINDEREARGQLSWDGLLMEEVAEALDEIGRDEAKLREELVQVAAVCCAWAEAIDRRRAGAQPQEERSDADGRSTPAS